ncbi:MAG: HPr(Ser) kinase/phosphatase, partial [Eubacterium sp.]
MDSTTPMIDLQKIVDNYNLKVLTKDIELTKINIHLPDINRPALQLAGFFDHFDKERVQLIGNVEYAYLASLSEERRLSIYQQLMSSGIPCLICCQGIEPEEKMLSIGKNCGVPIFQTDRATSKFSNELTRWLSVQLAPCITIH